MALMVAVLGVVEGVGTPPATAHVCVTPVEVDVGEPATITVGVPAEERPVVDVTIAVPAGFDLDQARPAPGWDVETSGSTVRYRGGEIPVMQCGYFTLTGTATRRAKLVFPVTTTDDAGATTEYGPARAGAQEVYAGIEAFPDEGDGVDPAMVAGVALVAGGLVAGGVWGLRSRRG